eukprot:m.233368 g.233368  ORF g.233368 m.233368 type:complete len:62 (-) comp17382_c0_seq2:3634-3819(-)
MTVQKLSQFTRTAIHVRTKLCLARQLIDSPLLAVAATSPAIQQLQSARVPLQEEITIAAQS